ncbi:hypothetical protein CERSUDRAFT_63783 [Gelatoporia subvermispora B]|uniref:Cytochrome P450 n=1 Tax=Ceriporiopsis subvermispora (strain B) TaxID=914234 RepID=M2PQK3_CERS8|nr:hypothetical protein CERSUDRAFT_63783 [Gelatoporia subvermispora B]
MPYNIASTILWAVLVLLLWEKVATQLPLPPGPKPLPLIGNVLDIPTRQPWKTYKDWTNVYGDIIYMQSFGQSIIILNSLKPVNDLFEKRSSNYSDRLQTEMHTLIGWKWVFSLMEYGQWWRRHRRAFHQYFNQTAIREYEPQIKEASLGFLRNLYNEPRGFAHHSRYLIGSSVLLVVYGIRTADKNDPYVEVSERAMEGVIDGFTPGHFWVDFLPFLKYVPAWMPGAEFRRKSAKWRVDALALKDDPWNATVTDGPFTPMAVKLMERMSHLHGEAYAEEEEIAKNTAGVAYGGATQICRTSTLHSFILAMALHPGVQHRAQEELMRVIGPNRLPEFSDRDELPYINLLCKECVRWQPVTPLGLAHKSIKDDEYNGFRIPGGSVLMQNTWAILHDPEMYPDPEAFKPERYLKDGRVNPAILDPTTVAFGTGRRICPGRYFSDMSLFINVASVLHLFDISPGVDEDGKPRKLEPNMTTGFLSHPSPFECDIKPRSEAIAQLISGDIHQGQ